MWHKCPTVQNDRTCVSYSEMNEDEKGPLARIQQDICVQRVRRLALLMHTDSWICKFEGLNPILSIFPASGPR
jgi:hypothetical protein